MDDVAVGKVLVLKSDAFLGTGMCCRFCVFFFGGAAGCSVEVGAANKDTPGRFLLSPGPPRRLSKIRDERESPAPWPSFAGQRQEPLPKNDGWPGGVAPSKYLNILRFLA